ncbi:hypothetical protein Mgra_00002825 [Meloidogyne graminicola]|uniref:Uncharacterized protein n=1 Tax=Meloidogyne graminicola TaxID=189291 RepID=A0A8S9ZW16_9BILA|nr:hypothetical protein Mgra_00002825 [Meloidogyne graminicola]
MEFILWNKKEFDKIYNCTGININDIPIEQRQYPIAAIICIILGFIYYILGINRCIEMAFPNIAKILFHGYRIYIWIIFCNLYGLYWLLFNHPYIFNGIKFEVLLDPLIGYRPFRAEIFGENLIKFTIHNIILAIGSPLIYFLFIICLFIKTKELTNRVTKEELMVK